MNSPIPGAAERIASLRTRYEQLSASIAYQESRVASQTAELERKNRLKDYGEHGEIEDYKGYQDSEDDALANTKSRALEVDTGQEEEEIKELEKKRRGLEDRVGGMTRDLRGLSR